MIEISIRKDGITVSGHANYAPRGQDIVCAAVSTLAIALINSIKDLTEDKRIAEW
ncbi:MAG: ribosomal-processing cysteine protease Prp [Eubacteriales bacterium]|nr:ribosomal-processing cysteine protease Prp [Eubacteriales bacterium]